MMETVLVSTQDDVLPESSQRADYSSSNNTQYAVRADLLQITRRRSARIVYCVLFEEDQRVLR